MGEFYAEPTIFGEFSKKYFKYSKRRILRPRCGIAGKFSFSFLQYRKHCGLVHNFPFRHGQRYSQHMEKQKQLSHILANNVAHSSIKWEVTHIAHNADCCGIPLCPSSHTAKNSQNLSRHQESFMYLPVFTYYNTLTPTLHYLESWGIHFPLPFFPMGSYNDKH